MSEVGSKEAHNGISIVGRGSTNGIDFVVLGTPPSKMMWEVEEAANILAPLPLRHWHRSIIPHKQLWGIVPATDIVTGGEGLSGGWLVTFYA